jgi:hypothetical protein
MSIDEGKYCENCAPEGELKSREDIREDWIEYAVTEGIDEEDAEKRVDEQMSMMPAWKG